MELTFDGKVSQAVRGHIITVTFRGIAGLRLATPGSCYNLLLFTVAADPFGVETSKRGRSRSDAQTLLV